MIKYFKSGKDFPYKEGKFLNWITDDGKDQMTVFKVMIDREPEGGAEAAVLQTLNQGFYAVPLEPIRKAKYEGS